MSLNQIIEGWKNHLLPEERKRAFIEHVSSTRLATCNECEEHSSNKKEYKFNNMLLWLFLNVDMIVIMILKTS